LLLMLLIIYSIVDAEQLTLRTSIMSR
jgi:hypothetical protein